MTTQAQTNPHPQQHLALVRDPQTGLLHGALYTNYPTPSGWPRFLLSITTKQGYPSAKSAAAAINNLFPKLEPIPLRNLSS